MTENHKQWAAWIITVLLTLAIALFFGVQYPTPPEPDEPIEPIPLGSHFSNPIDIEGSSSASAPALTFEGDTDTGLFRSAANTLNIASGGSEMLEVDSSGFTISSGTALDVDTNVDIDGSSVDIDTTGSIDLTSTEAAANAIFLDANGAVTTGLDIDVGSVSGMTIDGGLLDIGGASAGVADGDNDVAIKGVLEVDGEIEADGAIDADAGLTVDGGVTNIGGGTPTVATGDNDLYVTGDLEVDNTFAAHGNVILSAMLMYKAADATSAFTATASSCGQTYFLNAASEFQTILPAMSSVTAGCSMQFIVKAAPSGASYTIITGNSKENTLIGGINELEVDTNDDGPYQSAGDTITFVDGTAVVGDYVYLYTDGTSWYVRGQANADGGITLTQAD